MEALSLKKVVFVSDIDYEMAKCFNDMENIVHYANAKDFIEKYKTINSNSNLYFEISEKGFSLVKENFSWYNYINKVESQIKK